MRHIEFAPFYRSAIGFDRLFNMLDQATGFDNELSLPALQYRAYRRKCVSYYASGRRFHAGRAQA